MIEAIEAIDATWCPWWAVRKYEPNPWRPNRLTRCWERPHKDGVVRVAFEAAVPHDCEILYRMALSECADVSLYNERGYYWIEVRDTVIAHFARPLAPPRLETYPCLI